MIKAVIFDCFGVLTTDGWLPFKQKYFGDNLELKTQATDLNKQVDAGLADYNDFLFSVAELAGVPVSEAREQIENNVANQPLFDYISDELKPQYPIGLLSNAGANWLKDLFAPEQVVLFDAVSLSCESSFVKPDARAYDNIASKLGVDVSECVLIDDNANYCAGAQAVGMKSIVYSDFEQCRNDLNELLSNSKN